MILVVDDHVDSANGLARLLAHDGVAAQALHCGKDMFAALEGKPAPALIVLDLMMPEMNGMECLRRLREHPPWSEIPVIVFSADFDAERRREALALGARDFLVKGTISWDALLKRIGKYVESESE